MVGVWRKALEDLAQSSELYNKSLTADALSPDHIAETTQKTIDELEDQRHKLDTPLAMINNLSFEAASLQGLQAKLIQDLETADQIAETRIQFLQIMQKDFHKAVELVPTIKSNITESRRVLEASVRETAADSILERARAEYNDTLAEARAQEKMFRMRSRAAIAAWIYIGGFIGGLGGWKMREIRARRKHPRQIEEPASSKASDKS